MHGLRLPDGAGRRRRAVGVMCQPALGGDVALFSCGRAEEEVVVVKRGGGFFLLEVVVQRRVGGCSGGGTTEEKWNSATAADATLSVPVRIIWRYVWRAAVRKPADAAPDHNAVIIQYRGAVYPA